MEQKILKAINAHYIRVGDTIRTTSGITGTVLGCLGYRVHLNKLEFRLDCMGSQPVYLRTLEIVELVHRSLPMGVTEDLMEERLASAAGHVAGTLDSYLYSGVEKAQAVANLREVLDTYELGKETEVRNAG